MKIGSLLASRLRPFVVGAAVGGLLVGAVAGLLYAGGRWPFSRPPLAVSAAQSHQAHDADAPSPQSAGTASQPREALELESAQSDAIGIRTVPVRRESIAVPLRTVATVVPDESRLSHIHSRVAGWLETLYINTTGQRVRAGEPLAAVFSQELFSTQMEYVAALEAARDAPSSASVSAARTRLRVLGMSERDVDALGRSREAQRLVTLAAPRDGIVLRRGISAGTAIDPSTEILTVADLSVVWVIAEIPEGASGSIGRGARARLEFFDERSSPIETAVDFVYPTLTERTRTVRVRFSLPNPDGRLRPGLYGTAVFETMPRDALLVPRDAVVDTGLSQHVFIAAGGGRFEPRKVRLGRRLSDQVEVIEGLVEGEEIVAAGVFLLDSESRLRASGGTGTAHTGHGGGRAGDRGKASKEESPPSQEAATHTGHGN